MKKLTFVILFFLLSNNTYALLDSCNYTVEYDDCVERNANWSALWWEDDYICIQSKENERVLYQIILDKKFKEIDKKLDWYMAYIQDYKEDYLGKDAPKTELEIVDEIEKELGNWGILWWEYSKVCSPAYKWSIVQEFFSCSKDTTIINSKDFFETNTCMWLAETKLAIHKQVAYDLLKINKLKYRKESRSDYMLSEQTRYWTIVELMRINLWYLERFLSKTPSFTKKPYNW